MLVLLICPTITLGAVMRRSLAVLVVTVGLALWAASSPTAAGADGLWRIYASDGRYTYLGEASNNAYATDSICNRYGEYGSRYATSSIRNPYGNFGSAYSSYSPYNRYTSTPPILWNGSTGYYLSKNTALGGIDPDGLLAYLGCPTER